MVKTVLVGRIEKEKRERGRDYVAHLTVRAPSGFVTVVVRRVGPWLVARLGFVGDRPPEVSKFGPWPEWVSMLKAVLSEPGIIAVEGVTYPFRRLLASLGFWFDKKAGIYKRGLIQGEVDESEPVDFYEELGW